MVQATQGWGSSEKYHHSPIYSEDSVKERKRMTGAKCPMSPEHMNTKTGNRGTTADRLKV